MTDTTVSPEVVGGEDPRRQEAAYIVHGFALAHGIVAFLLANTLIGDTAILTALTIGMIVWIGKVYGLEIAKAEGILRTILAYSAGPVGLYVASKLLFWLPGLGNWSNAVTTVTITETIGWACIVLFSSGRSSTEGMTDAEMAALVATAKGAAAESEKENTAIMKNATKSERTMIKNLALKIADASTDEAERKACLDELSRIRTLIQERLGDKAA